MTNHSLTPTEESTRRRAATPPHNVRPWPLPRAQSPRVEQWRSRLAAAGNNRATIDEAVQAITGELHAEGTPLIEPGPSSATSLVTFVWISEAPHGIALQLNRMTDPMDLADTILEPLEHSPIHTLTLELPHDWLGSYLFVPLADEPVVRLHRGVNKQERGRIIAAARADPFAREHLPSKSLLFGNGQAPQLAAARAQRASNTALWHDSSASVERLADVSSAVNGEPLQLWRWSHPRATASSPTLLLCDGEVWRTQFPIHAELSRRIHAGSLTPLNLLYLDSGGPRQRHLDYPCSVNESAELLGRIRDAAGPLAQAGPWLAAGQSLGGLFTMLCTLRHPDLVATAIAQSPSLWWPAAPPHEPQPGWFEEAATAEPAGRVLLEAGSYEWDLVERVRHAAAVLAARRELIGFEQYPVGHDVLAWQSLLPDAIERALTDH
ncbi:enterochelin esterase domain-containing protein [Gulosibacter bifidus]|uniref:Enterochelin esterase domain-containing protein n=1 Tax=Gulosibacter bifidus TaxID=272239 RepID=A0ABW5RG88_9MICO|nr:alpha/beta hydrolase-fold protein [Gulosibacter bifidus]